MVIGGWHERGVGHHHYIVARIPEIAVIGEPDLRNQFAPKRNRKGLRAHMGAYVTAQGRPQIGGIVIAYKGDKATAISKYFPHLLLGVSLLNAGLAQNL